MNNIKIKLVHFVRAIYTLPKYLPKSSKTFLDRSLRLPPVKTYGDNGSSKQLDWKVRNMALSVMAHNPAINVDNGNSVKVGGAGLFKKGNGQHNSQLSGQILKSLNCLIVLQRLCEVEMPFLRINAKTGRFEQLLQQDNLSALSCRLPYQGLCPVEVASSIPTACHLRNCHRHFQFTNLL
jgi:hypothetical protein